MSSVGDSSKISEEQQKLKLAMEALYGSIAPSVWASAAGCEIKAGEHHEYEIRKANNDSAYNNLKYVPYCSTIPVQKVCEKAEFVWLKK